MIQLKGAATRRLIEEGLHPFAHLAKPGEQPPKCWARGEWSVFLDTPADIVRSVRYVENNPLKEGKPPQRWDFVVAYNDRHDHPPSSGS